MASYTRLSTYSQPSEHQISPADNNYIVCCIRTLHARPILRIIKIFKEHYLLSFDMAVPTISFTWSSTWMVNQHKGVQRQGLTESTHSYLLKCRIYQQKNITCVTAYLRRKDWSKKLKFSHFWTWNMGSHKTTVLKMVLQSYGMVTIIQVYASLYSFRSQMWQNSG